MWYVMQTTTGKEEELVQMIQTIVPSDLFEDCFVAYYERIWRRQGQSIVHVERLFPGYVFILSEQPKELFFQLKRVPAMSKIIADGNFTFLSLEDEEVDFLGELFSQNHIIQLSYVKTDGKGNVQQISGPLKKYMDRVLKFQFKKRYAIVELKLTKIEKTAALGIILDEDIKQELFFGKIEAPVKIPHLYKECLKDEDEGCPFTIGDQVKVISGSFESMSGVIWKIKKNTVEIGVHLFGQDMSMEVPLNCIVKLPIRNIIGSGNTEVDGNE